MPVTARRSKKVYEVLGEEVANELVNWFNQVDASYRADLRERNELDFARFDARLEQWVAEVRSDLRHEAPKIEQRVTDLKPEVRAEIGSVELRLKDLEGRLETRRAALRADMAKWMFGMWITPLGAMIALARL